MGLFDIRPYRSQRGGSLTIRSAPMNASEVFLPGELIFINSDGEAAAFPIDGTQALLADISGTAVLWGVAATGPGAASSAARPSSRAMINPATGTTYATGDEILYYPANEGNVFVAPFLVAGGAGGKSTAATGAARGIIYELTYESASTPDAGWGVEITAGVNATDVLALVIDVLDSNFRPITATGTTGAYAVFEMRNSTGIS